MRFVAIWSYDNYVPAHVALGRLKEDGFECWLKDENTVTIDPILSNAVGGIKLMVEESRAEEAWKLLKTLEQEHKAQLACPYCGSSNLELVTSASKPRNVITAIGMWLLGNYAMATEQSYHCFNCNKEFDKAVEKEAPPESPD